MDSTSPARGINEDLDFEVDDFNFPPLNEATSTTGNPKRNRGSPGQAVPSPLSGSSKKTNLSASPASLAAANKKGVPSSKVLNSHPLSQSATPSTVVSSSSACATVASSSVTPS